MIKKYMMQTAMAGLLVSGFAGCGSDNGGTKQSEEKPLPQTAAPKIEVVQNSDAMAVKVKEKDKAEVKDGKKDQYYYDYNIKSEYDPNARPENEDAAVRVKPRTELEANMNIRSPYEKVRISMLVQKLSKDFMVKCSACHDDYANGVIGPSLLGKDSDYIFNAIADFKSGKKSNVLMNDLIKMMNDEQIRKLADEIYAFNQKIQALRK